MEFALYIHETAEISAGLNVSGTVKMGNDLHVIGIDP